MSVVLYPVISTESQLREKLEETDILDLLFEDESITFEELPNQSELSADLTSCYDQFSASLPQATRNAFEQFADVVCWGHRDTPQTLDSEFQPDNIDFSCSPTTCGRLAAILGSIDQAAVRRAFVPQSWVPNADFFLSYLTAWRDIFQRAADSKQYVFAFVA
jgi:hypothetical protein